MYIGSITMNDIVTSITENPNRASKIRRAYGGKQYDRIQRYITAECAAHKVKFSEEDRSECYRKILRFLSI